MLLALPMQTVVIVHKVEVTVSTDEPRHSVSYWNRKTDADTKAWLKDNPQFNYCRHMEGQKDDLGCHDSYLYLQMYNPKYLAQHPEIKPITDADKSVVPVSIDIDPTLTGHDREQAEIEAQIKQGMADMEKKYGQKQ